MPGKKRIQTKNVRKVEGMENDLKSEKKNR